MNKINCWEAKKCGREVGGEKAKELGVCPAYTESKLDGVHSGKNSGRCCWIISGTYCKGEVQGTCTSKFNDCKECDFYQRVKKEEFDFKISIQLLNMLEDRKKEK